MKLSDIYLGGSVLIAQIIRHEWVEQGHHLTGNFEATIDYRISGNSLIGVAPVYAGIVDAGIEPDRIKVSTRLIQELTRYFLLRGYSSQDAPRIAFFTIKKWQKEGMPTQASKAYSRTGNRKNFIEAAFFDTRIDDYFTENFDFAVDEEFEKTKNETI